MTDDKPKKKRAPRRSASVVQDALNPERQHRRQTTKPRDAKVQQPRKSHGVYAKFFPDEVIEDAVRANLTDELIAMRCGFRNGVLTLGRIAKDLELPEDQLDVEQRMDLYKLYNSTTRAMDNVLGRIVQLEKTIVEIPYIVESTEAKKVQADKDRALTDKARIEYELLKKGKNTGVQVLWNLGFMNKGGKGDGD
ncbi:hypothetical protein SAMN05880558_11318 [Aeromonas sp. RU39B]|uniref:hypothetical protein n=1 Tax=Aeromonas sp. RU39B TaxID=1907416 RepID=UPI0009549528|nr:hypothetical protein [Aeromonas sp. RU39B]SIR39772.1 hypothetical protein SAMN05880558_11318 [Aeromonas sp. RU39B]